MRAIVLSLLLGSGSACRDQETPKTDQVPTSTSATSASSSEVATEGERAAGSEAPKQMCPQRAPHEQPLIGVSGNMNQPDRLHRFVNEYVQEAGGHAIRLNPSNFENEKCNVDGIVLTGGNDVPGEHFGEADHPSIKVLEAGRFQFDHKLIELAENMRLPILGICLGSQEMWISKGGTLVQDIPSELNERALNHRRPHRLTFSNRSFLGTIYPDGLSNVKSNHHQANDERGRHRQNPLDSYDITGRSPDGLVEAIESTDMDAHFAVGVQWHPRGKDAAPIYEALVERAKEGN
ncbi:MAG: gamma-glutamyl-gamma-aminobutyrate hydrolase family protein [Candidatus Peregrinibacteria bacterium]|nr:gamma-glutamyl-gamma-aminobutyrate hydrolase family protein [Candidatus Peregrinibacteria bacterium]